MEFQTPTCFTGGPSSIHSNVPIKQQVQTTVEQTTAVLRNQLFQANKHITKLEQQNQELKDAIAQLTKRYMSNNCMFNQCMQSVKHLADALESVEISSDTMKSWH